MRGRRYTLRTRPGDFVVEELLDFGPGREGAFGIYRLKKTGLDTTTALKIIAKRTNVPFRAIGCAGLKDRHGESVQYVSIARKWGDRLELSERSMSLELCGYCDQEILPGSHRGNRFEITLRRMNRQTLDLMTRNVELARGLPIPNYFDSQRFGSLRGAASLHLSGGAPPFDIVEVLKGNHEKALKSILTGTCRKEQSRVKALKRALAASWGDWAKCAGLSAEARYENYAEVFAYLREKGDFRGGLGLVRDRRLRMGALALQGWLWNEAAKMRLLKAFGKAGLSVARYGAGELLFPKLGGMALEEYRLFAREMDGRRLLLPRPWMVERGDHEVRLEELGIDLRDLEGLKGFGVSLSKEERPLFVGVPDLELRGSGEEESKAQRRFWATLRFSLPPGAYATVVVKALLG
ncbi:MAG: tRNA pseudouridine(13) synthase TruD [Euryarchaeota archaeon]|nr:tRNA pseudouridine(13) synthase TruD [Euryarchaeota archaeon]